MISTPVKLLCFLPLLLLASAQSSNQTISLTDSSVDLTGSWSTTLANNGFTGVPCGDWTRQAGSSAIFHFKGTAMYLNGVLSHILGANISSPVVEVTLDGNPFTGSAPPSPANSCDFPSLIQTNLSDSNHILNITFVGTGGTDAVPIALGLHSLTVTQTVPQPQPTPLPTPKPEKKPGKAAGIAIGVIVGAAIVAGLAWLNAHHLKFLFESLVFALAGWLFFKARRLVFIADKHLPNTEVTLFLTDSSDICDSDQLDSDFLVAWKVFQIGGKCKTFTIQCPCVSGVTTLGFGTTKDTETAIRSVTHHGAPARLTTEDGWIEPSNASREGDIYAVNETDIPQTLAIGTWDGKNQLLTPFHVVRGVQPETTYRWKATDLYVHAFSTHGYEEGAYSTDLVRKFKENRLTDQVIRVADLKPHTQWVVESDNGKLRLRIRGLPRARSKNPA